MKRKYHYSTVRYIKDIFNTGYDRTNCRHSHVNTYQPFNNFAYLSGRSRDID